MQNFGTVSFSHDPKIIALAILLGIVPSIVWLLFWLREDSDGRKEPTGLVIFTFIAGMLAVVCVLPVERIIASLTTNNTTLITLWATSEEIFKYVAFALIMSKSEYLDEPVDYPIYLITAALGFAALENTMYLIHPLSVGSGSVSLLTGHLRFLGSTLLHSVASGIIGISIGLSFFKSEGARTRYTFIGIISAIALHSIFNFFIIQNSGKNFLQIFGFLWVVTIIIMLLFEKLRRMGQYVKTEPVTA
jgi:RsiW-degrading membrane proteinase PrsW (M82 family)